VIEKFTGLGLVMLLAVVSSQGKIFAATKKNPGVVRPKVLAWRQTAEFPHDPAAFTQGFEVWDKNYFLESTVTMAAVRFAVWSVGQVMLS
jgi:glutamine cyclotransferase